MSLSTSPSLSSMMKHMRHLESSVIRVLMEATLKLSSLTEAGCFVLFETPEGRRFGGSAKLMEEFVDGQLTSDGAEMIKLRESEIQGLHHPNDDSSHHPPLSDPVIKEGTSSPQRTLVESDEPEILNYTHYTRSSASSPTSSSTAAPFHSRKRPSIHVETHQLDAASPKHSPSPAKTLKLSINQNDGFPSDRGASPCINDGFPSDRGAPIYVKEEEVVLEPDVRLSANELSTILDSVKRYKPILPKPAEIDSVISLAPPMTTNNLADDDWDDDIEEIIYDLDVTPSQPDLKPALGVNSLRENHPPVAFQGVDFMDGEKDAPEMALQDNFAMSVLRNFFGPKAKSQPSSNYLGPETPSSSKSAKAVSSAASAGSNTQAAFPSNSLPPHQGTLFRQLRSIIDALKSNQTEISVQKLDVLGQQNVEEMFTKGTAAYALLKSCLYTQGKILSQLCPYKDRDIKDTDVKAFFNDNFEAVVLICPPNLRECYFSENPFWLVDLLESASKRNSKVSLTAFIKDQARNGFKAEFKKKRELTF